MRERLVPGPYLSPSGPARVIGPMYEANWASEASPTLGCSIEISHDIYIAYYTSKSGIWLVISRVASYFHEPEASANTAYE